MPLFDILYLYTKRTSNVQEFLIPPEARVRSGLIHTKNSLLWKMYSYRMYLASI